VYLRQARGRLKDLVLAQGVQRGKTMEREIKRVGYAEYRALSAGERQVFVEQIQNRSPEKPAEDAAVTQPSPRTPRATGPPQPPADTPADKRSLRPAEQNKLGRALLRVCRGARRADQASSPHVLLALAAKDVKATSGAAQKLLAKAGLSNAQTKRAWKAAAAHKNPRARKPPRRPRSEELMSDEDLRRILLPLSAESCRLSARTGDAARTLMSSVQHLHHTTPELRRGISYRSLARRLSRGKLGFCKAKKRTDVCDVCRAWDVRVKLQIERAFASASAALAGVFPQYWVGFAPCLEEGMSRTDSTDYTDRFIAYIRSHATDNAEARAILSGEDHRALAGKEEMYLRELTAANGVRDLQEMFGTHFRLRDHQAAQYRLTRYHPQPRVAYFHMAYKENGTLPLLPVEVNGVWFARARLGYSVLSCFHWGHGAGAHGRWTTLFSRVLEKSCRQRLPVWLEMRV